MSSKWQWNNIDLWVTDDDIAREIKRAELFVLGSTESVFHFFGAGSRKITLKGMVIGAASRSSLEDDAINNTVRTLVTPWGSADDLRINTIKFTQKRYAGGTIDGVDYSTDVTPIYDYEIELITAP